MVTIADLPAFVDVSLFAGAPVFQSAGTNKKDYSGLLSGLNAVVEGLADCLINLVRCPIHFDCMGWGQQVDPGTGWKTYFRPSPVLGCKPSDLFYLSGKSAA